MAPFQVGEMINATTKSAIYHCFTVTGYKRTFTGYSTATVPASDNGTHYMTRQRHSIARDFTDIRSQMSKKAASGGAVPLAGTRLGQRGGGGGFWLTADAARWRQLASAQLSTLFNCLTYHSQAQVSTQAANGDVNSRTTAVMSICCGTKIK